MSQYEFDAVRWCESMKLAHWRNKDFVTAENFKRVRLEIESLRARLDAAEAQRDGLKNLVMAVSVKYPHIDTGDVDGKNWFDARDEALAKLEDK